MAKKLRQKEGTVELLDALTDLRSANRFGQYKIGKKALHYPDNTYIAKTEITDVEITTVDISTKGCCGLMIPSIALLFIVNGKKQRILVDSEKQAEKMKAALEWMEKER